MKELKTQESEFIEYLEEYKKLIAKVARIYCKNPEDQKDLIQEIIIQLWKSFPKYDKTFSVSTWTYRIALNVSISYLRKTSSRTKNHRIFLQENDLMHTEDPVVDDKMVQLYLFIERLKPIDKAIIILSLENCSNKEISEVMGMTASNVSTRKLRIKEELKNYFETAKNHKDEI